MAPDKGTSETGFYYYVDYYCAAGDPPTEKHHLTIGGPGPTEYEMSRISGTMSNGTWRVGPINLPEAYALRYYNYCFLFETAYHWFDRLPDSGMVYNPIVDDTAPPAPQDLSASPSTWTNTDTFLTDWTNPTTDWTGIGAFWYKVGSAPGSAEDGQRVTTKPLRISTLLEGEVPLYLWLEDGVGNKSHENTSTVTLYRDQTAPTGCTLSIENGAAETRSLTVTLTGLSAEDALSGVSKMGFSNNGVIWSAEEPCNSSFENWDLSKNGGSTEMGLKTVFARFKDVAGNWSDPVSASIIYGWPILSVTPESLEFAAVEDGANPAPQSLSVTNSGIGSLEWSITDVTTRSGREWLEATPDYERVGPYQVDEYTLALYHCDTGSGTTLVDETGSYNATFKAEGEPAWTAASRFGPYAVDLANQYDYIVQPILFDAVPAEGTIEFWFKSHALIESWAHEHDYWYVRKTNDADNHVAIYCPSSAGYVQFEFVANGVKYYVRTSTSFSVETWYHLACTWGSEGMRIYVSGVEEDANSYTGKWVDGDRGDFTIGNDIEGANPLFVMGEMRVSDIARIEFNLEAVPSEVVVSVDITGLESPGTYEGSITIASDEGVEGSPAIVPVTLRVRPSPLIITTNGGADFTIGISPFTIAGACTDGVADMKLNGVSFGHTLGVTTWQTDVELSEGVNTLSFTAVDADLNESDPAVITVTYDESHDWDGDGIRDGDEGADDLDGDGLPNYDDTDSDGDEILDMDEGADDLDNDGLPNYLDTESDGDGIPDTEEGTGDADSDGVPNYLDTDSDGDGIPDAGEGEEDTDDDGLPNYLDSDSDADGISDANEGTDDPDGDGIPNFLDTDSDGDGMPDSWEVEHGLNPLVNDANGDPDSDGYTNLEEYEAGTDPRDAVSVPRVVPVLSVAALVILCIALLRVRWRVSGVR